ncbi:MAG: dTMP kinase [Myxococcota bacterium]
MAEHQTKAGRSCLCTRQPTTRYRTHPDVRAYLDRGERSITPLDLCRRAAEDRRRHIAEEIAPAIAAGTIVLCDRYVYSSIAFFEARGVAPDVAWSLNADVPTPHNVFLLDLDPKDARRRVVAREGGVKKFEEKDLDFMANVRSAFLQHVPDSALVIDATQSADEIFSQVLRATDSIVEPA